MGIPSSRMAERQEAKPETPTKTRARSAPPRPWWRRRRFWQVVIALEVAAALAVSYVAADDADGAGAAPIAALIST